MTQRIRMSYVYDTCDTITCVKWTNPSDMCASSLSTYSFTWKIGEAYTFRTCDMNVCVHDIPRAYVWCGRFIFMYSWPYSYTLVISATCNTLQHTATHCNTLQHTATHHVLLALFVHTHHQTRTVSVWCVGCVHVYVYVHENVCICLQKICVYIHKHVDTCVYMYTCIYMYIYINIYVPVYMCMYMFIYVCIWVYIYMHIYIYIYE